MYYPYLRGRQYELIGLRELCEKNKLDNVIPVIEPVKTSPTLLRLLQTFCKFNKDFIFIKNPSVGTFQKDLEFDKEYKERFEKILKECEPHITNGIIMTSSVKSIEDSNNSVALCFNMDQVQHCNDLKLDFKYVFIPDSSTARRKIKMPKVLFEDRFEAEERNADYADDDDKSFSNDFFYYKDDSFEGFSDFSVVGNEYNESGFAPFAVAIHIVYLNNEEDDELRIHHFVSNSNDDINNPQKKFSEALSKLVSFQALNNDINNTYALNEFKRIFENETYPGLGTIKKLSIMHHIELVSKILSSKKD